MATYHICKSNATRRGKDWSLTFEQFKEFAIKTNYLIGKGRTKDSYTIDRIDPNHGYHAWNIQALTNSDNVKKHHAYKRQLTWLINENNVPYHFRFNRAFSVTHNSDTPF